MKLQIKITPVGKRQFTIEFVDPGVSVLSRAFLIEENFFLDDRIVDKEIIKKLIIGQSIYLKISLDED